MQNVQLTDQFGSVLCYPFGERAIVLEYVEDADNSVEQVLLRQRHLLKIAALLSEQPFSNSRVDCVPGNQNLTVLFDPLRIDVKTIQQWIIEHWQTQSDAPENNTGNTAIVDIPVLYGGEYGPDLAEVAALHNLSSQSLIELHSTPIYTVLFNGFLPGFPYLAGLPEALHTPRRSSPRMHVSAGSIAIGGSQTGIYPMDSPGGWQIIGRCQLNDQCWFNPDRHPPQYLSAGQRLRFVPVAPGQ